MSDEKKVEPVKKSVTVDELKKQVDGLSAYVRKIVRRLEELGGIDINMDGKVGMILLSLMLSSGIVFAADTVITGFDAVTGIGTFKVVSDGTSATLTADKVVASTTLSIPLSAPYTTNTLTGDGKTNVFIWATAGSAKVLKSITTTP